MFLSSPLGSLDDEEPSPADRMCDAEAFCILYFFRCLRMNRVRLQDPVLQQACKQSSVHYEDLGLPQEMTVWVDPGEVSCRSA